MATRLKELDRPAMREERQSVRMWALVDYGDVSENAVVRDLSATGFGIETARVLPEGAAIAVTIGASAPLAAIVVHASDDRYGCRLADPLDAAMLDALTRDGPFASARPTPAPAPQVASYPRGVRAGAIAGAAIACWTVVLGLGFAIFA
ncbi:PilZ domain-containing protein [Sphingomonas sp.]|uniref:PilZ domain-containing protein n=1 Tax=Sphingomonas sp. TaxID=28214 RepID=UPI003B00EA0B